MQRKKKQGGFSGRKAKASFTIEAAVIIPITFMLIAALIFLTFYAHDKVVMSATGTELLLAHAEEAKEKDAAVPGDADGLLAQRLISTQNARMSLEKTKNGLHAAGNGSFPIPFAMVRGMLGEQAEAIGSDHELTHLDARKELLGYKALADGIGFTGEGD